MLQESPRRKFTVVAVLAMIGSTLLTSAFLEAARPEGNETPSRYGRIDEMGSVPGPGIGLPAGEYLFSAELNGSHLTLDVIEDDMTGLLSTHIHETMYGGLQDDTNLVDHLDDIFRGPAVVDFTYRETDDPGDALVVTDDAQNLIDDTGTVEWTDGNGVTHKIHLQDQHKIHLQDQKGKNFSAPLAHGHRAGLETLSTRAYSNDSLSSAPPVPEPATDSFITFVRTMFISHFCLIIIIMVIIAW